MNRCLWKERCLLMVAMFSRGFDLSLLVEDKPPLEQMDSSFFSSLPLSFLSLSLAKVGAYRKQRKIQTGAHAVCSCYFWLSCVVLLGWCELAHYWARVIVCFFHKLKEIANSNARRGRPGYG